MERLKRVRSPVILFKTLLMGEESEVKVYTKLKHVGVVGVSVMSMKMRMTMIAVVILRQLRMEIQSWFVILENAGTDALSI